MISSRTWYLNSSQEWVPSIQQMVDGLRLNVGPRHEEELATIDDVVLDPEGDPNAVRPVITEIPAAWHPFAISMRQGVGMICLVGLVAGLLPFLFNAGLAARMGVALPLAQSTQVYDSVVDSLTRGRDATPLAEQMFYGPDASPDDAVGDAQELLSGNPTDQAIRKIAELQPIWPVPIVALLSALGEWINWPLRLLTVWLVYGTIVLLICHLLGATTTIQNYLAATSYAALPILLYGLLPIPLLGALALLVGTIAAAVVYVVMAKTVTGLSMAKTISAMVAPLLLVLVLGLLVAGLTTISIAGGVSGYF